MVNSGQFCKMNIPKLAGDRDTVELEDEIPYVGRGNIRMALAGPAVTAIRPPRVMKLRRNTP